MHIRYLLTLIVALIVSPCFGSEFDPTPKGAELLVPFKADLKAALMSGMAKGPVNAMSACRTEAPRVSGKLSVGGVVMGRSSHKLRNPGNSAPEWVAPILAGYVADSESRTPSGVELGGGRYGYVEPIMVQPLCLTCHGDSLHPDVAAAVRALYPHDEATGFSEGDFRGVFWVEFSAEP